MHFLCVHNAEQWSLHYVDHIAQPGQQNLVSVSTQCCNIWGLNTRVRASR